MSDQEKNVFLGHTPRPNPILQTDAEYARLSMTLCANLGTRMKPDMPYSPPRSVLRYDPKRASQSTIRRHYLRWRREQKLPLRCDNVSCTFHTEPLLWLGASLQAVLDHVNGNRFDNRPENLRLLCPNCDSQLSTRGGKNKGRIADLSTGGFALRRPDGKRDYVLPAETGYYALEG